MDKRLPNYSCKKLQGLYKQTQQACVDIYCAVYYAHAHAHIIEKWYIYKKKHLKKDKRSLISLDLFQHGHHKQLLYWPFINM